MLRTILYLCGGFLAMVAMLFVFKGLLFVADAQDALVAAPTERAGPPLAETFAPAEDWPAEPLDAVRTKAGDWGAAAMVVLHEGRLAADWGRSDLAVDWGRGRASLVSLLQGIAIAEGVEGAAALPTMPGTDPRRADSVAVALEEATGLSLGVLIDRWLARPLGWTDFDPAAVVGDADPESGDVPVHRVPVSVRDLARLAQMVADGGLWQGQAVVPRDWLERTAVPLEAADGGPYSLYRGVGWWVPGSGRLEIRGHDGQRLRIDRRYDLIVVVGTRPTADASEQAAWTMFGDRMGNHEFAGLMQRLQDVRGLGEMDAEMAELIENGDVAGAVAYARAVRARDPGRFLYTEVQLNRLGYDLLGDDRIDAAVAILELNAETFPEFANTHDSLGEAYYELGDLERARVSYQRARELNPHSRSADRMIRRIEDDLVPGG
jgi:hypothetical protein